MKAVMVMYDTLCRDFLAPYGCTWVETPNFSRLAEKAVTFDENYVCSLPCMPARRDLHNSRVNFLQRDWGPLEPFDDSMPEILKQNGIYTALTTDHYHYVEDGGCTYHNRYSSWVCYRGQEGDACCGDRSVLFGFHASQVAVTDGQYTYFRAPLVGQEYNCYDYTLMPTRMRKRFDVADLQKAEFTGPLPNTKGCRVLKTPAKVMFVSPVNFGTKLYDVQADPRQKHPIDDPELEAKLAALMVREMKKADAPAEQFDRLGLPADGNVTAQMILDTRDQEEKEQTPDCFGDVKWSQEAKNAWRAWGKMMPPERWTGCSRRSAE